MLQRKTDLRTALERRGLVTFMGLSFGLGMARQAFAGLRPIIVGGAQASMERLADGCPCALAVAMRHPPANGFRET